MTTVYRLIPKQNNVIQQFRNAHDLSVHLLGRRVDAYIVIKSDAAGDRVVTFTDYDVVALEHTLNNT